MTLAELSSQLHGEGLFPVRVESIPENHDDMVFVGSISEFIQAAKAMQSSIVFVSTFTLSEEHFLRISPDEDEDEDDVGEPIDLCQVVPELNNLKGRIGQDGHIDLSVPGSKGSLTLRIAEDWIFTFAELHSQALRLLRQVSLEKRAQEEALEEARTHHLLRNLRGLVTDKAFARLPTQKAMLAYALEDFPELESLGEEVLRNEIQNLKARIDAQGSRRK